MSGDETVAISLTVIVAAAYLLVLRIIDPNEKEPVWALAMILFLGGLAAALLPLVVDDPNLELSVLGTAVSAELAKLAALGLGVAVLGIVAGIQGFSELNGPVDGIVYGAAAGLGFAAGDVFVAQLSVGQVNELLGTGPFTLFWTNALAGLSEGLFGAILGAGIGAAAGRRSSAARYGLPVAGLVAAVATHALYIVVAEGSAFGGTDGLVRVWVALLLPLAFIAAALLFSLRSEREAIEDELGDEVEAGVLSRDDLRRLHSPGARRREYSRRFMSGDFDGWLALRALQNRQVQLALAKRRADGGRPGEIERLRAAVYAASEELRSASDSQRPAMSAASPEEAGV